MRQNLLILLNITLFLTSNFLRAQPDDNQYNQLHLDIKDGLPSSVISALHFDKEGFMWVGTEAGLSRYNGRQFENYSLNNGLPGNYITAFAEDSVQTKIWVGTNLGVASIDKNGITPLDNVSELQNINVKDLAFSEGTLWILTPYILYKWSGSLLTKYPLNQAAKGLKATSLYQHENGLLIGTSKGLLRWHNGGFNWIWHVQHTSYVVDITAYEGGIWFTTHTGRLFKSYNNRIDEIKVPDGDRYFMFGDLSTSKDSVLYLLHESAISVFVNGSFDHRITNLVDKKVWSLLSCQPTEHALWVSSSIGLIRISKSHVIKTEVVGDSINHRGFACISSTVGLDQLVGGNGGQVYKVEDNEAYPVFLSKPMQQGAVTSIISVSSETTFVASTFGGIARISDQKSEIITGGLSSQNPSLIFTGIELKSGDLLYGTNEGVIHIDDQGVTKHLISEELSGENVLTLFQSSLGDVWVGTQQGVYTLSLDDFTFQDHSVELGVSSLLITGIAEDSRGYLYFSSKGKGILKCQFRTKNTPKTRWIDENEGLTNPFVVSICIDNNDELWGVSTSGIFKLNQNKKGEINIRSIDNTDGINETIWNNASIKYHEKGSIYVTSGSQMWIIDPIPFNQVEDPPQPSITNIRFSQYDSTFQAIEWNLNDEFLSLNHDLNDLEIYFDVGLWGNSELTSFAFRLIGLDSMWQTSQGKQHATYTNLPPGEYTFETVSILNGKRGSRSGRIFFSIMPPFWKQWWFISLCSLTTVLAVYLLLRYASQNLKDKERRAARIKEQISESRLMAFRSQTNPHFIFNALSSIQHFITHDDRKAALSYLSKFSKLLRNTLDQSRMPFTLISKEIELLTTYVEIEQLRFEHEISVQLQIDPKIDCDKTSIPSMIIQPFVENAVIHGLLPKEKDRLLLLGFKLDNTLIEVTVEDNGIGREASTQRQLKRSSSHKSYGIEIARERLELLQPNHSVDGNVVFQDLFDANGHPCGTRVTLLLPFKTEDSST